MIKPTISSFILALLIGCTFTLSAQSKTWIGPVDGNWNNGDHWSPEGVPNANTNAFIPNGSIVNLDNVLVDTLTVENGATLVKSVDNQSVMNYGVFQSGSVLNMYEGTIYCNGMLVDGTVNGIGPLTKGFRGGLIELNNTMTIEAGSGPFTLFDNTLRINSNGVLNLPGDGILDIAANNATLENQGLIQKTGGFGDFIMDVVFNNNNGTVNVSSGNLTIPNSAFLTNGEYNVSSGSSIIITANGVQLEGTLSGLLEGPLVFLSTIQNSTEEAVIFDFSGSAQLEWAGGSMHIGDFINEGLITITDTASANHGINISTLLNNGVINMRDNCKLTMSNTGTLHNGPIGTINLLDSIQFTALAGGLFLNEGALTKDASGKNAFIGLPFTNDNGMISVLGDTLFLFNSSQPFINGQYDVAAGAAFSIYDGPEFLGTLTGQLDGPFELKLGSYSFAESDTTVFNFTGDAQVDWYKGSFTGGNLKNMGTINAMSTEVFANQIVSNHNLINEGQININGVHGIYMSSGTLLNTMTGIIDMQADNLLQCGGALTNLGLFKKTGGAGESPINGTFFHDDPGLIHVEVGTLSFSNLQAGNGDFAGAGSLALGNNYVVSGDVSPGNSPGTLSIAGAYASTPSTMLHTEINGNTAGTDYDVLTIADAAILKGGINVTLGFPAVVNDQFEIVTAASVDSCLFPSTVSTMYDGMQYTFDVICDENNVTLSLIEITVGIDELRRENLISVYPNPMSQTTRIDLSETIAVSNKASLLIINNLGQSLRNIQILKGTNSIDLERGNLKSGLYNILLIDGSEVISNFKLMLE